MFPAEQFERIPMKKFYLYHQERTKLQGLTWAFFDSYRTYDHAIMSMQVQQKSGIWKVWKIEEVWEFE